MPSPLPKVLVVTASAWLVCACGTGGLRSIGIGSAPRADVTKAQADMATCRSAARSTGELASCPAKFGPALVQIAQDSYDQAGRAQDRATRINLFAVAANTGWDSGIDSGLQVADAAIQAGGGECDKIPANEFTPARDCVLLRVGPGFVAHMRTVTLIDRVAVRPPASIPATEKR